MVNDCAEVLHVDIDHQPFVWIVCPAADVSLLLSGPRHLAAAVEDTGKISRLWFQFNHVCIETRQEQYVVDELQQPYGVVLYLSDELFLLGGLMFHLK